jgi:hypothetical protein
MQLEAANANVASVQTNVRYATIYAPFEGHDWYFTGSKMGITRIAGANHIKYHFFRQSHCS